MSNLIANMVGALYFPLGIMGIVSTACLIADKYDKGTILRFTLLTISLLIVGIVGLLE